MLAIQDLKKSFVRHEKFSFSYAVSYWRYQITEWIKNHQPTKLAEYTLTLLLADMG